MVFSSAELFEKLACALRLRIGESGEDEVGAVPVEAGSEQLKHVCVQLPDEYFDCIPELYINFTTSFPAQHFFFLADSTFGLNDADVIAAQHVNADLLIFVGYRDQLQPTALSSILFVDVTDKNAPPPCSDNSKMATKELDDKNIMKRYLMTESLKEAEIVGILVGTFSVERYADAISYASKLLKREGKRVVICYMGDATIEKLGNLPEIDVWVQICEAESIILNSSDFFKPITSLRELAIAFDDLDFLTKLIDFTQILPTEFKLEERLAALEVESEGSDGEEIAAQISIVNPGKSVVKRSKNEVALSNPISSFLAEREWKGLEVGEGRTEPARLEEGLDGYAAAYKNPKPRGDT